MNTPDQPEAPTAPAPATAQQQQHPRAPGSATDDDDEEEEHTLVGSQLEAKGPGATARVFQCPKCRRLLDNPVGLPCGISICKSCVPEGEARAGIDDTTWPGTPERWQDFECPLAGCGRRHPKGGCWPCSVSKTVLAVATAVVSGLAESKRLVEAFEMLRLGRLADTQEGTEVLSLKEQEDMGLTIRKLDESLRGNMDCGICYQLLYEPWTTPCGHTFCRHCIKKALEQSTAGPVCPTCRRVLPMTYLDNRLGPPNEFLQRVTRYFWAEELVQRKSIVRSESLYPAMDDTGLDVPVFVCTVSFPSMPTFLHVFEPRYRAMIRRAWGDGNGGRHFGMMLHGDATVGTHLRIEVADVFPDGRSMLETKGVGRFRIKHKGVHEDGYVIAETEDLDDVSLYEEETREAEELDRERGAADGELFDQDEPSAADLDRMKTKQLMGFARTSINQMAETNPRWLNSRILAVFGECPDDPAAFPWWFASIFPVSEEEKLGLLDTITVRERMKICCRWIVDWRDHPEP
ncbi:LON peptidase N-terminal domain and RING finger protein 1 [Cytospora mali]|uniref:LON peptidase N-terminal domain and RING finger protein 1 n=1 Tax=Cytospora mali TaxID=578113 RepID=A0A194URJ9_CYTMA|nr:LON peptidase N-terminal domain and RING finger protein 1 [Valsa mali var. pyri (nom. inval.)]